MNQDIIKMAREAGVHHSFRYSGTNQRRSVYRFHNTELERFFHMAQADMKEKCAKVCENLDDDLPDGLAGWQYAEAIRAIGDSHDQT